MDAENGGFLPHDVLQRISDIVANNYGLGSAGLRDQVRDIKSCTLVSRAFVAAFQPHLFRRTSISGSAQNLTKSAEGLVQKRLKIVASNPHLGSYVKYLTVTMRDGRNDHDVPDLLNHLGSLRSLSLATMSFRNRTPWAWFTPSFREAIARLCRDSTLETLNLNKLEGIPASLFLSNPSLTSVSLAGSHPVFDFSSSFTAPSPDSPLPLSLNVSDVDLTKLDLQDIFSTGKGFFQRVRTLKGSTGWEEESNAAFNTFTTLLAGTSPLEHLSVTIIGRPANRGIFVTPVNLLVSLKQIKGLRSFTLTSRDTSQSYLIQHFVPAVPHIIASLDTTSLERLSLDLFGVNHHYLFSICGGQGLGSRSQGSLDAILASRLEQGKLEALREVRITIQIDRSEFNMQLEEPKKAVREAGLLSSLPVEKVRAVLKSKIGDVMYDSRPLR